MTLLASQKRLRKEKNNSNKKPKLQDSFQYSPIDYTKDPDSPFPSPRFEKNGNGFSFGEISPGNSVENNNSGAPVSFLVEEDEANDPANSPLFPVHVVEWLEMQVVNRNKELEAIGD